MKVEKLFTSFTLAEGVIYISEIDTILWVDITECALHYYNLKTRVKDQFVFNSTIGCVVPYKENLVVCAVGSSLVYFDLKLKKILKKVKVFNNKQLRFNDGKCDKYGNLWVGTMDKDFTSLKSKGLGSLYCIKEDKIINEYKNFSIPNGLEWIDNYFFHIDTQENTLYRYQVENQSILKNKQPFITNFEASPDGMTIDNNNNFWVALWGGKKVVCYCSKSKEKLDEIKFNDHNISCVSFGMKNYNAIFVTSAEDKNNKGSIYKINTNYIGKAPNKYGGKLYV